MIVANFSYTFHFLDSFQSFRYHDRTLEFVSVTGYSYMVINFVNWSKFQLRIFVQMKEVV